MSIEYIHSNTRVRVVKVKLDGKIVGHIHHVTGSVRRKDGVTVWQRPGYQYTPKGQSQGGDVYPTLALCQQSLEAL